MDQTNLNPSQITDNLTANPSSSEQTKVDRATKIVSQRILIRLAHALVEEDLTTLKNLWQENVSSDRIKDFLLTKAPNLEAIIKEEIEFFKEENKQSPANSPALT